MPSTIVKLLLCCVDCCAGSGCVSVVFCCVYCCEMSYLGSLRMLFGHGCEGYGWRYVYGVKGMDYEF